MHCVVTDPGGKLRATRYRKIERIRQWLSLMVDDLCLSIGLGIWEARDFHRWKKRVWLNLFVLRGWTSISSEIIRRYGACLVTSIIILDHVLPTHLVGNHPRMILDNQKCLETQSWVEEDGEEGLQIRLEEVVVAIV